MMLEMKISIACGGMQLHFNSKPGDDIRLAMKANGYRWSPTGAMWHKRSVSGAADFIGWLRKAIEKENGIIRPDGACWKCKTAPGFFRNRGAAAPVLCDTCYEGGAR
jgi:hypothetical protein